ncbi:hypothetical protein [Acidovorax radicis]|uniref:hypothetical protein n=1 Tax=Acidovorax radicis TaxID=758826 RepID=UPI001CF997CA|nr:hypothetical protein [Acidovorax radicis]UCV00253.1 hypothetical protein KI609_05565 [Acidovorax radicis]
MTDKTTAEREAFEEWMNQQDQAEPEPERTYELDDAGMNQLTEDCMWIAWKARASLPLPGAQEAVAPHGWLYDWTHSSATGRPDETYTGFTKDEQHARKHDNCTPVYAAPQPALSAGWVSVKDRLPPPFDEVWVHPRPSDYCCEASVDTVGNWKYSEYETNFGVNHIKCTVEYWMQPPALPVEPSMDGENK